VEEFLAQKPADITAMECPYYRATGNCPYGVECRLLVSHQKEEKEGEEKEKEVEVKEELNGISRELQHFVRRSHNLRNAAPVPRFFFSFLLPIPPSPFFLFLLICRYCDRNCFLEVRM